MSRGYWGLCMSNSHYVIPFKALLLQAGIDEQQLKDGQILLTTEQLYSLIRGLLILVSVDEEWYVKAYPDVDEAIAAGAENSAKEHFISSGYFEGRLPGKVIVDEKFYTAKYMDVAEGIQIGEIGSAQEHFDLHGFVEGRQPYKV